MKKITVALDIGVLGSIDRSGVFRVVEELFNHLDQNPHILVKPCTSQCNEVGCWEYLVARKLNFRLKRSGIFFWGIRFLSHIGFRIGMFPHLLYKLSDVTSSDIYVSPWNMTPQLIRSNAEIKVVHFIYDIIPIIMPEVCVPEIVSYYKIFLNSIFKDDTIVCISHNTKNDFLFQKRDMDLARVHTLYLGADKNKFYPENSEEKINRLKIKYNILFSHYFLSVSTVEPRKNLIHTISSFVEFIKRNNITDTALVLIGNKGWGFNDVRSAIENYQDYKKYIIVTGFIRDDDMAGLYSGAICFLYMSLYEGFGLPILEAMQCGVPVITSDNSSIPEVVGDAGLMFLARDQNALIGGMMKVYCSIEMRELLKQKSLSQAKKFSWENTMDEFVVVLKKIINYE